jgi:hypothetical protein
VGDDKIKKKDRGKILKDSDDDDRLKFLALFII